ncbi:MAG: AAA family ATPase, partial [Synergistaceae bacterium]|nr:AAA family ATPase [Synergistaceae bacterium]
GSGKTYGALLVAKSLGGTVVLLDTENGSGDLYATEFDYDVGAITAPYTVNKYLEAIHGAEQAGYDIIIIDSLSHAWAGTGGLLDLQGQITDASYSKNSYTAWRKVTPLHNDLIEAMLNSPCHIIATMRSKTEYIQTENEKGKKEIVKVGLAPVQREGMDYEFTTVFDLGQNHTVTVSKDRTRLFDGQVFTLSEQTGEKLKEWLDSGVNYITSAQKNKIYHQYLTRYGDKDKAAETINFITGNKPSKDWTQEDLESLQKGLL